MRVHIRRRFRKAIQNTFFPEVGSQILKQPLGQFLFRDVGKHTAECGDGWSFPIKRKFALIAEPKVRAQPMMQGRKGIDSFKRGGQKRT